jgi:hypothetical protein
MRVDRRAQHSDPRLIPEFGLLPTSKRRGRTLTGHLNIPGVIPSLYLFISILRQALPGQVLKQQITTLVPVKLSAQYPGFNLVVVRERHLDGPVEPLPRVSKRIIVRAQVGGKNGNNHADGDTD